MFATGFPLPECRSGAPSVSMDYPPSDASSRLQQSKERVRVALDTLGERNWRDAVQQNTPPWMGTQVSPVSRAYYKMWEMGQTCGFAKPGAVAHIAEAPGGFVEACQDLYGDIKQRAQSWTRGPTWHAKIMAMSGVILRAGDGNLIDSVTRRSVIDAFNADGPYDLVTADGASAMDHSKLEAEAIELLRAESEVALSILAAGGTFILKVFECSEMETIGLIASLCACFDEALIIKPTHSRPTNSERYIVASGFRPDAPRDSPVREDWLIAARSIFDKMCVEQTLALDGALTRATMSTSSRPTHRKR